MKMFYEKDTDPNLIKDNKEIKELKSNDEGMIITNQTPFYGESGGQVCGLRYIHMLDVSYLALKLS